MHEKDAHLAAGPVTVAPKRQQAVVLLPVLIATGVELGGGGGSIRGLWGRRRREGSGG